MKILLVEDLPEMSIATRELLEGLGHQVTATSTGEEALRALAAPGTGFETLITDLRLPGMSGTDVILRLLSQGTNLALIAYSASRGDVILRELVLQGRVLFLRKPFSVEDLVYRLTAAAEARSLEVRLPKVAQEQRSEPRPSTGRWIRRALLATAFVLLLGGAFGYLMPSTPGLPKPPTSLVRRGANLDGIFPTGTQPEFPAAFLWQEVPGATGYRIEVQGVDGAPLWQGTSRQPSLPVTDPLLALMHRSVVYSWRVEAVDTERRVLAASEKIRFMVKPESLTGPPDGELRQRGEIQ